MYESFLNSVCEKQWKRIGLKRRAGVNVPLFSIYSKQSVGIGELPDLKFLVDWCRKTNLSLIQLLPLNEIGSQFSPYDPQSGFAIEPMYLSLNRLREVNMKPFHGQVKLLRSHFPSGNGRVNYGIKAAKLEHLWKIFQEEVKKDPAPFKQYRRVNRFWLKDYVCFKVIKEENGQKSWEEWPVQFRNRNVQAIQNFRDRHKERIRFYEWLQWQLFEQLRDIRQYARSKRVLMMGDLPFLPSRDSSDVWANQEYFKLDLSSGAPPDVYFFKGQRWGTPPCDWEKMSAYSYHYLAQKLKYAENFYDALRIDHVVGFFRLWTIPLSEPLEHGGLNGVFDPSDESKWEEHGRKLLLFMIQGTKMLITAEDLGTVPECSYRVLKEFAIPGIDVQRWIRDPAKHYDFKPPEEYRRNSVATLSTHDMAPFNAWWEYEAGTVYEPLFRRRCEAKGIAFEEVRAKLFDLERSKHNRLRWKQEISHIDTLVRVLGKSEVELGDLIDLYRYSYDEKIKFWHDLGFSMSYEEKSSPELVERALEKISSTVSIFNVQLLQDWLALADILKGDSWEARINTPGVISEKNWTFVVPVSLEEMKSLPITRKIKRINTNSSRV